MVAVVGGADGGSQSQLPFQSICQVSRYIRKLFFTPFFEKFTDQVVIIFMCRWVGSATTELWWR